VTGATEFVILISMTLPHTHRRSAPTPIQVVAIVQYLGGFLALAGACLFAILAVTEKSRPTNPQIAVIGTADAATLFWTGAVVFAVTGVVAIVLGRKLQLGRNWARLLLIVLNVLSIGGTLYEAFGTLNQSRWAVSFVLPVICLILLNLPSARSWCRYHTY
jgi:hypothetical protein